MSVLYVQWAFPGFSMVIRSVVHAVDASKKKLLTVCVVHVSSFVPGSPRHKQACAC